MTFFRAASRSGLRAIFLVWLVEACGRSSRGHAHYEALAEPTTPQALKSAAIIIPKPFGVGKAAVDDH